MTDTNAAYRIPYIDLAKGFCICIVILFHTKGILHCEYLIDPILFSFCMLPPFFFLSGLFFNEECSTATFLKKKTNKLLIPFAFFYLTTAVIIPNILHYLLGMKIETVVGWRSLWAFIYPCEYPNIPIWFLWCLFVMNLLFWGILRFAKFCSPNHPTTTIVFISIGFATVGTYADHTLSFDIANIPKALIYMPFFCLGFIARKKSLCTSGNAPKKGMFLLPDSVSRSHKLFWLLSSLAVMLLCYIPVWQSIETLEAILFYICSLAGIIFVITLASLFNHLPLILYLGRYSIIVLLTHGLLIRGGTPFINHFSQQVGPTIAIIGFSILIVLSFLAIIPLCRRYLPHVTAQEPIFPL